MLNYKIAEKLGRCVVELVEGENIRILKAVKIRQMF